MRLCLALAGVLLLASIVLAHDRSGNPNWIANGHFTSLIDGSHCCGIADCVELHPDDVVQTLTAPADRKVDHFESVSGDRGPRVRQNDDTMIECEAQAGRQRMAGERRLGKVERRVDGAQEIRK
jgi:hypothetical protein